MHRNLRLFLILPLLLTFTFLGCDSDPSTTNPPDGGDAMLRFGGSFEGGEVVLERIVADTPNGPVEIDLLARGEDRYDFSGAAGFGGLDPWGRIREVRVSVPIRYVANRRWTVFAKGESDLARLPAMAETIAALPATLEEA